MISLTYETLQDKGFQPTRHGTNDDNLPIYLIGKIDNTVILMKHQAKNQYYPHATEDDRGNRHHETDIERATTICKIDKKKPLKSLIAALNLI